MGMAGGFTKAVSEAARATNRRDADAWAEEVVRQCERLAAKGFLTYAEQAEELNRQGKSPRPGGRWNAQSLSLCCRRDRNRHGRQRTTSGEVHELLDGRWRTQMRAKILELKSYGVTRYGEIAENLNAEGIQTRRGRKWTLQGVVRLMKGIGQRQVRPSQERRMRLGREFMNLRV